MPRVRILLPLPNIAKSHANKPFVWFFAFYHPTHSNSLL
nr:MAG TPA: hypothetical protein [Caudoviricetes sp.]